MKKYNIKKKTYYRFHNYFDTKSKFKTKGTNKQQDEETFLGCCNKQFFSKFKFIFLFCVFLFNFNNRFLFFY